MKFTLSPIYKSALLIAIVCATGFDCLAQAARPNRGTLPSGSYSISDIEKINLSNGNLNLSIPLASLPPIAGGNLGFTVHAEYNSKGWDTMREELQSDPLEPTTKYVVTHLQQAGGWRIGGTYQLSFEDITWDYSWLPPSPNDPEYNLLTSNRWSKVVLIAPDGATHELRPVDYQSYTDAFLQHSYLRGYYKDDPNTAGTALRYYSYDGSHIWAKIDPSPFLYGGVAPSWVLYLPDGTRVEQANGIQRIIDANGNKIKIWSDGSGTVWTTHYQDEQTLREIKYVYDSAGNGGLGLGQVQYQTVTGIWKTISINFGTTHVFGKVHAVIDPECADASLYVDAVTPVVRSIVFPQTEPAASPRQLTFAYNSDTTDTVNVEWRPNCYSSYQTITSASHGWGALSRMVLTSGAIVDYVYSLDGQTYAAFDPDEAPRENLTTKTLTHDGISETWTYNLSPTTAGVTSPDGSFVGEFRYSSDPAFSHNYAGFGGKEGLVYRTNNSNKTMIERHWSFKIFSGGDNIAPGASVLVAFNPVVDTEYKTLLDDTPAHNPIKMSAITSQYDFNGNLLSQTEYDWFDPALVSRDAQGVPTGVPASATVLRVINNSYYNPATTSSSGNVYAKRSVATATPLILNAPQQTTLGPSIVQFSYDGQAYGAAPTVGNLTTKKVWVDIDSKWVTTTNTYGLYGNLATSTDGRGKVTRFFYDDATHALPTRVVVDPENGTGTQTSTTAYDFSTGLVTIQTDANGQISTIDYTNQLLGAVDPFGRPGIIKANEINIGGQNQRRRVTTTYVDSARQVIVATDLIAENDKLLKTRTTTDQLGRTVLKEQTEDGSNYTIAVENKYLDMGRVTLTSRARRSAPASTDSWTRVTNDVSGRIIEIATFAGATQPAWTGTAGVFTGAVTFSYNANFTTAADQTGKVRRSMMDALGRLRRLDEPDGSNNLGSTASPVQPTSYAYDVFGNLTTVTQGSQTRTFAYDSISRLRTVVSPESGTVTYQYDDNSNLLVRTDARGVSTHLEYDSINRPTRRWYNGSSLISQITHNTPTLPGGVGATDEVKFFYDTQSLPAEAPSYSRGSAIGRLVAQTYGTGSNGDYYAYDVLGRQTLKIQQTGTVNYQLSASYSLSNALVTMTYPSGHTVTDTYDQAGRLAGLSGNLGDGTTRTYATGILYSATGGLIKEQFGTTTPIYNKLFYNSRGQLAEIRASTSYTGPNDTTWNRGAIINHFSYQCWGMCDGWTMSDNNGNLLKQEVYIPQDDQVSAYTMRWQQYDYDSLNRLNWVREIRDDVEQWKQQLTYDRWGNRTINTATTYGVGINNKAFTVNTANNRLGVPVGQSGTMTYDAAGNLINDTYTGAGNRTYDAENKITSAWGGNNQAQLYSYDASGQRIKRKVDGVETWQVYGFGGELVAQYAASGSPASPQKEYGYRNGQLLITADGRTNVALSANGGVASASSAHTCCGFLVGGAINGNVRGPWGNGEGWNDATENVLPDWFQVDFAGTQTIDEIDVFSLHDNYTEPNTPTETQTFSLYGLVNFEVQYWNGSAWVTIPGGSVSGNNKVWRKFTFAPITTSKIRLWITSVPDSWSRLVELQAWATQRSNFALASAGGVASASSTLNSPPWVFAPAGANNGNRSGTGWGSGEGWNDTSPANTFPDWLQIDFSGSKTIDEIDVFTGQDNWQFPSEPTEAMTFSVYGLTGYDVQYWNGSSWVTVTGGSVTGNNKVWRKFTFTPVTTTKIRVLTNASIDGYSRITELEAWGTAAGASSSAVQWLVSDHLGTPRMVFDQTGSLANMKRHDYLPFGEELVAPSGGRSAAQGYAGGDGIRLQFTQQERDVETNLDYFGARYYSSNQGRFTSPDPLLESAELTKPQSLNRYSYCLNRPLFYVDPDGLKWYKPAGAGSEYRPVWFDDNVDPGKDFVELTANEHIYWAGEGVGWVALNPLRGEFQEGFSSYEEALHHLDPGSNISQFEGILEVASYISATRIGAFIYRVGSLVFSKPASSSEPEPQGPPPRTQQIKEEPALTVDDILNDPKVLEGKTLEQVKGEIDQTPGWVNDVMRRSQSNPGGGWTFREMLPNGRPSGRMIQYHPGGGHHGAQPYWKVSSPGGGTIRVGPQFTGQQPPPSQPPKGQQP